MSDKNYYDILGVSKTSNNIDIKKAYKRLAIRYHPDRNRGDKASEEKFKEIKEAYEVLSDEKKRSMYDQYGHSAFTQSGYSHDNDFNTTSDFSDIFGDIFGDIFTSKKKRSSNKNLDILYGINLSLEEVAKGISKKFKINVIQKCNVCHGSGCKPGTKRKLCNTCKGTGNLKTSQGFFTIQQTCPSCHGQCYIVSNVCYICRGSGTENTSKNIFVKIPAGINDNDRIRLVGKGNYSIDGNFGDLYIKVKVNKHPIFIRKKNDLYCEVPISFSLAALGGEIKVPTLDGGIKLYIPPETQTGKLFRIKSKGIKFINSNYYGDLLCKVLIETPVNLNKYQRKLLYDLGQTLLSNENINNPKTKSFFDRVKIFFDNLTN